MPLYITKSAILANRCLFEPNLQKIFGSLSSVSLTHPFISFSVPMVTNSWECYQFLIEVTVFLNTGLCDSL